MKLATYRDGSRDGHLVVVSRDLSTAHFATGIATRMQQLLDDWNFLSPQLEDLSQTLNHGKARHAFAFDPGQCLAPLPRAGHWAMVLPEEAGGGLHREAANDLAGAHAAIGCAEAPPALELRLAALMDDVPRGAAGHEALEGVRLLLLALTAAWGEARPFTACSPVAVTPDELGPAWAHGRVAAPVMRQRNGRAAGQLVTEDGRRGSLSTVLAGLCTDRALRGGSLVAGPPWRASERLDLAVGDTVVHELQGADGLSAFGALEQTLTPRDLPHPPRGGLSAPLR